MSKIVPTRVSSNLSYYHLDAIRLNSLGIRGSTTTYELEPPSCGDVSTDEDSGIVVGSAGHFSDVSSNGSPCGTSNLARGLNGLKISDDQADFVIAISLRRVSRGYRDRVRVSTALSATSRGGMTFEEQAQSVVTCTCWKRGTGGQGSEETKEQLRWVLRGSAKPLEKLQKYWRFILSAPATTVCGAGLTFSRAGVRGKRMVADLATAASCAYDDGHKDLLDQSNSAHGTRRSDIGEDDSAASCGIPINHALGTGILVLAASPRPPRSRAGKSTSIPVRIMPSSTVIGNSDWMMKRTRFVRRNAGDRRTKTIWREEGRDT